MESFSLLKYWRGGGGGATIAAAIRSSAATPAVATAVLRSSSATTDDCAAAADEGPFFDLEFTALPADDSGADEASEGEPEEGEFNFELSAVGGGGDGIRAEDFSPSDDLFFKGKLVPLEPNGTIVIAPSESGNKPHFPVVSLLKSATKFRVFLLGLRKPKQTAGDANAASAAADAAATESPKQQPQQHQSRFFVKFKMEEVPIVSLFTRDNSSRNSSTNRSAKPPGEDAAVAATEEKNFAREVVQKYLNMIKPLYVRVSRKHGEKPKLPGEPAPPKAAPVEGEPQEAAPVPASSVSEGKGKWLRKSQSASATVAAVPSPPPQRRDDSLLEQQDGIQSAIAHCKRSFTAPEKGSESPLVRTKSEPIRGMGDQS